MAETLRELDKAIASGRDKKRFYLKDKGTLKFDSLFGSVVEESESKNEKRPKHFV